MPNSNTILVIDDNDTKRYTSTTILRRAGFNIDEAANGRDGLYQALAKMPSLIILDVNLPDISGFEVLSRLKARPETAGIPVLHLSAARMQPQDKVEGLERGADGYLTGDVEPHELVATVRALMRVRRSEELANQLSRQLHATFDTITDGVCVLDVNRRVVLANRRIAGLLGMPLESIQGQAFDLLLETRLGLPVRGDRGADRGPGATHTSTEHPIGDRWFWWASDLMLDEHGRHVGSVETLRETTQRKQEEQELQEAKRVAELANEAKSSFLANMSHEMRTPLGAILGFCELIVNDDVSDVEKREYLAKISRNAGDLAHLVDDILDLSKVEAGRLDIEQITYALPELVSDVVASLRIKAEAKAVALDLTLSERLPHFVTSDPTRLRQILLNVIGNAVKFTESGSVHVDVDSEDATPEAHRIKVTVTDTGTGMTQEAQERLFQAFSQADSSTTRRFGGTGLGLALSRRLARALGGDLDLAESVSGRGSTFVANVVVRRAATPAPMHNARIPANVVDKAMLDRVRILLAEDAPDSRLLIKRYLTRCGAEVDTVENGEEAVQGALNNDYDIVLMDMQMPLKDGYSATRELRGRGYTKPIIALTAHAMREERERSFSAGCDDHLTKPITGQRLTEKVLAHVTRTKRPSSEGPSTPS